MILESFITKDGQNVSLNKITIFVGPNNTGKSQTLKDIRERLELGIRSKPVIVKDFTFNTPSSIDEILRDLDVKESTHNIGHQTVTGLKSDLLSKDSMELYTSGLEQDFQQNKSYNYILGNISKYRVTNLNSSTRLNLVTSTAAFNPNADNPSNLLQSLFLEKANEALLQDAFKNAFEMDVKLDYSELISMCLRVVKKMPEIPEDPQKAYRITQDLQKIDNQGDGFKSFVGIVLGLLFSKNMMDLKVGKDEKHIHIIISNRLLSTRALLENSVVWINRFIIK